MDPQADTNQNTTQPVPQPVPPPDELKPEISSAINATLSQKEQQVQERKQIFFKKTKIMIFAFLLLIVLTIVIISISRLYLKYKPVYVAVEVPKDEETQQVEEVQKNKDLNLERSLYKSDLFKLTLKYPSDATLIEREIEGENPQKLEIAYFQRVSDTTVPVSETTIMDGYIFRITLLDVPNRNLDQITEIKRNTFVANCPQSASISTPSNSTVDGIEGKSITILNCNADYKVFIIPRFGIYYEIMQLIDGDVGIRQKYESITDEILLSLDFYLSDEEIVIDEPFKTFLETKMKFSFRHPNFDEKCCDMPVPFTNQFYNKFIILGNRDTTPGSNKIDTLGVFGRFYDKYKSNESFADWFARQKELLLSEYKVATGNSAVVTEEVIGVGDTGKKAYRLKGYSWREYDYIFIDVGNENAVVFVIDNKTGDSFERMVEELIASIKFF